MTPATVRPPLRCTMESVTSRTSLRRLLAPFLLPMGALACASVVGSCGGGDGNQDDVESLLDRAFRQPIERADLKIDGQLTVDGLRGLERPVRLEARGPYIGGGRVPELDVDINLGAQGAGQTVQFGLLRTAERAFVKFGGEFYEQPRAEVLRANRDLAAPDARRAGSLAELGLRPRTWVVDAREEGDEKVAGVTTRHVSGRLDVRVLLRDLNRLVRRSASAVGGSAADAPAPFSTSQLDEIAAMVRNPSFDVYVGREDDVIRRLSAQLEVRVPEEDRPRIAGIEGGALRFAIEFSDVDGDQVVEAPARARRIADLTRQLGGLGALGGIEALGGGAGGGGDSPRARTTPEDPATGGSSSDESEGVEAFRRYSECLDRAPPEDTAALSRCAELLR